MCDGGVADGWLQTLLIVQRNKVCLQSSPGYIASAVQVHQTIHNLHCRLSMVCATPATSALHCCWDCGCCGQQQTSCSDTQRYAEPFLMASTAAAAASSCRRMGAARSSAAALSAAFGSLASAPSTSCIPHEIVTCRHTFTTAQLPLGCFRARRLTGLQCPHFDSATILDGSTSQPTKSQRAPGSGAARTAACTARPRRWRGPCCPTRRRAARCRAARPAPPCSTQPGSLQMVLTARWGDVHSTISCGIDCTQGSCPV